MKKYYQLILLVLSAISIISFVIYKHEYDRLRKVLEVLDVFGTPDVEPGKEALINMPISCLNGSLKFIPDFWHQYGDNTQMYSAFQVSNEKGWSMNSLALVNKEYSTQLKKQTSCALISGDGIEDKFEGTMEWKKISNDSTLSAYSVICNVPEMQGINPHLFSVSDSKSQLSIPLHLNEPSPDRTTSLCLYSADPFWHSGDVLDFILYYYNLGVENFFIYHKGIGDHVISALKNLVITRGNMTVNLATWNRPTSTSLDFDSLLIHHDCAWRHNANSGPAVTLQMDQFLVLPKGVNLSDFVTKHSRRGSESSYEVHVPLQSLCNNVPNAETSPIRLTRLMKSPSKKEGRSALIRWTEGSNPPGSRFESVKVDSHAAKVLVFESCSISTLEKIEDDPAIKRFSALVQKIPVVKM